MKVSIVAVAGAFRTGKSFLLDLFLRYLRAPAPDLAAAAAGDDSWMVAEGRYLEGNVNPVKGVADGGVVRAKHDQGFAWRGGRERNTTGIWLCDAKLSLPAAAPRCATRLGRQLTGLALFTGGASLSTGHCQKTREGTRRRWRCCSWIRRACSTRVRANCPSDLESDRIMWCPACGVHTHLTLGVVWMAGGGLAGRDLCMHQG
jgi:hypothetical protein